jgi:hypothetical protein
MEERNILEKVLDMVMAEEKEVGFVSIHNWLDEDRISEIFSFDPESPLIVVGMDDKEKMVEKSKSSKLKTIFSRPRTSYVKLPCDLEVLKEAVKKVKTTFCQSSIVLETKAKVEEIEKQVRYLRHRHLDGGREGDPVAVGREARIQYGWEGSDEEIMVRLKNFHPDKEMAVQFSDKIIPGVFCDVEGTLLDFLGKSVQPKVVEMLQKHTDEGESVALWSGGDPEKIQQELKAVGIDQWSLLSKYDFRGCVVEVAIDDIPEEKLLKDYGIKAETYIHHNPSSF